MVNAWVDRRNAALTVSLESFEQLAPEYTRRE